MSTDGTIREHLRDRPLPGEAEAAARSWRVVEAALGERRAAGGAAGTARRGAAAAPPAAGALRRRVLRVALAVALLAAALGVALSPAGATVGHWIGDRFGGDRPAAKPAFAALPRGGSVLAISGSGAYAIRPDGSSRRLGAFSEAGWSPHGLHVVGAEGRQLVAVDAAGTLKWTLTTRRPVSHPAWSTGDGFAVAYLEGHALRVVAGNGDPTTNRVVRRDAAHLTPAWGPHSDRVLTYGTTAGAIARIDVETGRTLWRTPAAATAAPAAEPAPAADPPRALAWSRGGHRLVALRSRSVTVLDRTGRVLRTIALPGVAHAFALHPSGARAAVVLGGRVVEIGLRGTGEAARRRQLFQGNVDGIAWSQDGRRLLLAWRDADQWLLLGPGGRISALHGVSGELGAAGGFPRVAAWCCAR
jgi:hypothetical protein